MAADAGRRMMPTRRDIVRIALQSAAAGILSFLIMRWAGLPQISWALVVALFTIHASVDSAIGAALDRIAGTLIGAAAGLLLAFVLADQGLVLLRIAVIAAITNGLAASRPKLQYAAAAGAVVAVQPTADIEGAIGTALAIVIGGLAGVAASVLVWPEFGRSRALRALASALREARGLVDLSLSEVADGQFRDRSRLQRQVLQNLRNAESIVGEARFRRRLHSGATLPRMVTAADRLWHSLAIVERVVSHSRSQLDGQDLTAVLPHLAAAREALCALLDRLADAIGDGGDAAAPDDAFWQRLRDAQRQARSVLAEHEMRRDSDGETAIHALLFGLDQVGQAVRELQDLAVRDTAGA